MKTGVLFLVIVMVPVNDNRSLFSDAKLNESTRRACGKGQFYYSDFDKCMPCSFACKTGEHVCRRHGCYSSIQIQSVARTSSSFRTKRSGKDNEFDIAEVNVPGIGVSRIDDTVTIRWKQVIGKYTAIKVRYCETSKKFCVNYIVPDPKDTYATVYVDPDKAYYYYVLIEDGGTVVYTSDPLVVDDSSENMATVYVGVGLVGAAMLTIIAVIICTVVPWKRRQDQKRSSKVRNHRQANYSKDEDVARMALPAIRKSDHTYANVGTDYVNVATFLSKGTTEKHHAERRAIRPDHHDVPKTRVHFEDNLDEPSDSDNAVDINSYDYVSTWQHDSSDSGSNTAPAGQTSRATLQQDVLAQIHVHTKQTDQVDPVDTSSYEDMRYDAGPVGLNESQSEQCPEGTYNDVRIVVSGDQSQHSTTNSGISQTTLQQDVPAHICMLADQTNQADHMHTSSCDDMQDEIRVVSDERQRELEPEGTDTYNDVRIVVADCQPQHVTADSGISEETLHHVSLSQDVPARQACQKDRGDFFTCEGNKRLGDYVSCKRQTRQNLQEPEGTYNDVRVVRHGQSGDSTAETGNGQDCLAKELTPCGSHDDVDNGQRSSYEHPELVIKHEYLDFRRLSPEELKPKMLSKR